MLKLSFVKPSLAYSHRGIASELEENAYESIVIQDVVLQYHALSWTRLELETVLWRLLRLTKLWYESKQKTVAELRESFMWLLAIGDYFPQPCVHD